MIVSMGVEIQIGRLLDDYVEEVQEAVDQAAEKTAKATVAKLKKESPRGKGRRHYADGWRSKKDGKHGRIVYNAIKPSLTFLLNDGRIVHTKTGQKTVKGDNHITKANDFAQEEFERSIKDLL